ncbi:MAG: DUF1826 domain-containing protein [Roseobacter sp.]|uniref:DUF1826 domain-containing protein n=1 Tax=Tateyamaria sp. TaxID=1929288 RepID=UPI003286BB77
MNPMRTEVKNAAIGVGIADEPTALDVFLKPGCAAAIWRKQTPQYVQSWLDKLPPDILPRGRVILQPHEVADTVRHLFDIAGMPTGSERDWLQSDITGLAEVFSNLLLARYLRLRLDVVKSNACRRFHIDSISARLICTYRGTGTQYGVSVDGAEPTRVFTVKTGAPCLLRGTLWPADPPSGLLHRSPPIEGTGQTRFVLVLDPVADPEDEI